MISSTLNKGFQLTFNTGITISVQFGKSNYCSRRNLAKAEYASDLNQSITQSQSAEIAIWDAEDNTFEFEGRLQKGWVEAEEVAEWIYKVSKAKTLKDIK
jgi:hypothetical protein